MATTPRTFKLVSPHLTGPDIRDFQRDLAGRFASWNIDRPVADDGDYGSGTRDAAQQVCIGLGILPELALKDGVTPELRIKIRHPENRTPEELARSQSPSAVEFRAKLRAQFHGGGGGGGGAPAKTLTGIDVSNAQPNVDWARVKAAGHSFAFHKVSEGLGTPDRTFPGHWKAMRSAGLVRGVYHFARPQTGRDPKAEAREFLGLVQQAGGLQPGDLLPVLDIEAFGRAGELSAAQTHAWAKGFVEEVNARIGHRPIIYTGSFWRDSIGNPADNLGCHLWLAAYVADPKPFIPRAWEAEGLTIWQHTEHGTCDGIPGDVDLNRVPGGDAALNALRL
ncbi:MAG: lysozyme [Solirubrobacteraceae bacterium]|jgi:GH25 family lysozyme M1 (1,4-beta-N-acetylmuramidase)|nr:lysozyme [Solirubrobacteraceae bacterium]